MLSALPPHVLLHSSVPSEVSECTASPWTLGSHVLQAEHKAGRPLFKAIIEIQLRELQEKKIMSRTPPLKPSRKSRLISK